MPSPFRSFGVCFFVAIIVTAFFALNDRSLKTIRYSVPRLHDWIVRWWALSFPFGLAFALDRLVGHTIMAHRYGRPSYGIIGPDSPIIIFLILPESALLLWAIVTTVYVVVLLRSDRKALARQPINLFVLAVAHVGIGFIPGVALETATLKLVGPGDHAEVWTSLSAAMGDMTQMNELIRRGVRVEATVSDGQTALVSAAVGNQTEMVKLLLARGADPNTKTSLGQTPLSIAASHPNADIAQLLVEHGALFPCAGIETRINDEVDAKMTFSAPDPRTRAWASRTDSVLASWAVKFGRTVTPCAPR